MSGFCASFETLLSGCLVQLGPMAFAISYCVLFVMFACYLSETRSFLMRDRKEEAGEVERNWETRGRQNCN